ncbi:MAG: 4Fe-4S dicluster domain-containing protein [Candidatus Omnitrophica bacterium]|nr:4Fe-4S dicluster domain-containing protein [Candidatus Omnitrophota bacterium]
METYFLKHEDILGFYERIDQEYQLLVPTKITAPLALKCESGINLPTDDYLLKHYSQLKKEEVAFNDYRCVEPIRTYFTHFKEEVCSYFPNDEKQETQTKPFAISGVKNCDLFSLKIQDFVFLGGNEPDTLYTQRREGALIISSDCPHFKEACFCRAFGIDPYPQEGFDFNLSALTHGYLVDVGSPKAKSLVQALKEILVPATSGQLSGRATKRDGVVKHLDEHLLYHKIPAKETLQDIVRHGFDSSLWQEQIQTCVECGGCVFMCDTCHCFLLADQPEGENAKRIRIWDGCLYKNFTRVAGGANPLKMRYMRLRNRYLKKFDFFIDTIGYQACCGCGRCIEVCPGRIDIRHILRRLYEEKNLQVKESA